MVPHGLGLGNSGSNGGGDFLDSVVHQLLRETDSACCHLKTRRHHLVKHRDGG